tara:strand:+ start:7657 stop:8064 length:408 start_codon:yes stop_codon:yes gene_type:complete
METIILISVLSTLGVVALVTAIVVMFTKLNKKVGNEMFNNEMTGLINLIDENQRLNNKRGEKNDNDLSRNIDEIYRAITKVESKLDSRTDKLHDLIKLTEKELVNQLDYRLSEMERLIFKVQEKVNKVNEELLTN